MRHRPGCVQRSSTCTTQSAGGQYMRPSPTHLPTDHVPAQVSLLSCPAQALRQHLCLSNYFSSSIKLPIAPSHFLFSALWRLLNGFSFCLFVFFLLWFSLWASWQGAFPQREEWLTWGTPVQSADGPGFLPYLLPTSHHSVMCLPAFSLLEVPPDLSSAACVK